MFSNNFSDILIARSRRKKPTTCCFLHFPVQRNLPLLYVIGAFIYSRPAVNIAQLSDMKLVKIMNTKDKSCYPFLMGDGHKPFEDPYAKIYKNSIIMFSFHIPNLMYSFKEVYDLKKTCNLCGKIY